jgi:predicted ATPase
VQTLLGDFFLAITMLGKQCIVETHSEYLIDRLRWRTAACSDDTVRKLYEVYFVEKDKLSSFRKVEINRFGAIQDWPKGFFDQSQAQTEQILLAATRKLEAEEKESEKSKEQ